MSAYMTGELLLFVRAFWNGALLLLAYDVFRILRRVLRHGKVLTALEDFIYWLFCTFWLLGTFTGEQRDSQRLSVCRSFAGGAGLPLQRQQDFCQMRDGNLKSVWKNTGDTVENYKKGNKKVEISDVSV